MVFCITNCDDEENDDNHDADEDNEENDDNADAKPQSGRTNLTVPTALGSSLPRGENNNCNHIKSSSMMRESLFVIIFWSMKY